MKSAEAGSGEFSTGHTVLSCISFVVTHNCTAAYKLFVTGHKSPSSPRGFLDDRIHTDWETAADINTNPDLFF